MVLYVDWGSSVVYASALRKRVNVHWEMGELKYGVSLVC